MIAFERALAWTLVHFLWEGASVALVLAASLATARRARVRYALASGAMAAMAIAFVATLLICWPELWHAVKLARPAAPVGLLAPAVADAAAGPLDGLRESGPPRWFVPVWMAGVALFYAYSVAAWFAARRLRTRGTLPVAAEWRARLAEFAVQMGVRRKIALLESCLAEVPVVIGYLRPVILLPAGMAAGLPAAQVEAILMHELAHIRRHDYLARMMETLVEGLLFYHPAVWWIASVARSERENCCDDEVVARMGDARGYAAALARLELRRSTPALAATGGNVMKRIHRLIEQPEAPRGASPLAAAGLVLVTAAVAFAAWPSPGPAPQPKPVAAVAPAPAPVVAPVPQESTPIATPYTKWVQEDVACIITDAERKAFRALSTDAEREHFIEQFWLRRDPTPGTPANEFKDEHYRRIAYANTRFTAAIPGWKTDRGRIYIVYGPPDEIEDHGATPAAYAYQAWLYKFIEGVGNNVIIEFIDPAKTGEFRMTMDPMDKDALHLGVNVTADPNRAERAVSLAVPVVAGGHEISIAGTVATPAGAPAANFQDRTSSDGPYTARLLLPAGTYLATVTLKDTVTGESHQGVLRFVVR